MANHGSRSWQDLPGRLGLPLVGDTFKLLNDPISWAGERARSVGEVSNASFLVKSPC